MDKFLIRKNPTHIVKPPHDECSEKVKVLVEELPRSPPTARSATFVPEDIDDVWNSFRTEFQDHPTIISYLDTMTEEEKYGFYIAKKHLGTSFDLEKSNGFRLYEKTIKR